MLAVGDTMTRRPAQLTSSGLRAAEVEADRVALATVLAGDRRARSLFVERFARLVYAVVGRTMRRGARGNDEERVEEAFAEVFVALFDRDARRLRQWTGACSLATWVRLVAASVAVDRVRRMRGDAQLAPLEAVSERLTWEEPTALEAIVRAEELAAVGVAMQALSESDRELLVALYVDQLTPGQIAAELGVAPGALYTRKNRALERLRRALLGDGGGEL